MSEATTRNVRVAVEPEFLAQHSDPRAGVWAFAYHVAITNLGEESVQLVARHWVITDAGGRVEEVRGAGVVGEQPVIAPGETYRYSSGCPLPTAMGTMHGSYEMVTRAGQRFDATIAPFTLVEPFGLN
jgi:ApaG protein